MRPYIAHLMADLLADPITTIAHPGYVAAVLAAYGREIGSVPQIFLPPPFGTPGRPYKARQIVFAGLPRRIGRKVVTDSRKHMPRGYNANSARTKRVETIIERLAAENAKRVQCPHCPLMIDPANLTKHIAICHED